MKQFQLSFVMQSLQTTYSHQHHSTITKSGSFQIRQNLLSTCYHVNNKTQSYKVVVSGSKNIFNEASFQSYTREILQDWEKIEAESALEIWFSTSLLTCVAGAEPI